MAAPSSAPGNPCASVPSLAQIAHDAVGRAVAAHAGAGPLLLVDATAGNGHDTLFLARAVGENGLVAAFDVQAESLTRVRERLKAEGLECRARLFRGGHERMEPVVRRLMEEGAPDRIAAVVFNLGFLPGSDKAVITRADTTLAALQAATRLVCAHGIVAVHMYSGHAGGREECEAVLAFGEGLPWREWRALAVVQHNKPRNKEWLLVLEPLRDGREGSERTG